MPGKVGQESSRPVHYKKKKKRKKEENLRAVRATQELQGARLRFTSVEPKYPSAASFVVPVAFGHRFPCPQPAVHGDFSVWKHVDVVFFLRAFPEVSEYQIPTGILLLLP